MQNDDEVSRAKREEIDKYAREYREAPPVMRPMNRQERRKYDAIERRKK
jgi:hypothetical protein